MKFPDDSQRILVIGRTGTGKTVAGCYHLALRDFNLMPWMVYNLKEDALINSIGDEFGKHIKFSDSIPKKPGIYVVHGHPDDTDSLQDQMRRIWERQNTGVFVDETLVVASHELRNKWFRVLLTQGRSLHCPIIMCTQKPAWIDTFCFSEAEFFQVFNLNTRDDRMRVAKFTPIDPSAGQLPPYHSYYYDIADDDLRILGPVPKPEKIIEIIRAKMPKRRFF